MAKQSLKNIFRLIEVATDNMPINEQFVADLKVSIEKQNSLNNRIPSKSYKPSSMTCVRNMYFQVAGEPQDEHRENAILIGIMESGTDRHERLQKAVTQMKDFNMECEYIDVTEYILENKLDYLEIVKKQGFETKLYHKDLNISFLCDGIIKYKGDYYILEIKTETIYKWQGRAGVAEEHLPQGTTYSACLGIDKIMFIYENRDNCDKKAYILEVTEEMKWRHVISKIEECNNYLIKLTPPPIPIDITKKACQYCNYRSACRKAGKG